MYQIRSESNSHWEIGVNTMSNQTEKDIVIQGDVLDQLLDRKPKSLREIYYEEVLSYDHYESEVK
jgi:hypothetical protein